MKAMLEFDLPEDESELQAAVQAMNILSAIRDFGERLRTLKKYGHPYQDANEAVEVIYTDYCEMMEPYL